MRFLSTSLLLIYVAVGLAHDGDSCLSLEDANTPVCLHYFEGSSIELPVRAAIDGIDEKCGHLVVSVLQRQGLLLARLGESLQFDELQCSRMTSITLDLPDVRSETDILVRLSMTASQNEPGKDLNNAAAVIALRVYPDSLLEPLARLADQHSLIVFDDDGRLTSFLDQQKIDYVRGHEAVSRAPIALLVNAKEPERLLEDRDIARAVIFQEKVLDMPQVRAVSDAGRTRVYVELPVLHELDSSPLAQKALLRILQLAINPDQTDRG